MGQIKTTADQVFRDMSAPGSAVPHEPVKPEIRDLFGLIDTSMDSVTAAAEPAFLSFGGPCIYDFSGIYGAADAFYVPRNRWIRRNGVSQQGTLGANTTLISGYYQLNNPSPGQGWCVYYDMADPTQPYKATGYPGGPPTNRPQDIILIAILRGEDGVVSPYDVLRSEVLQFEQLYFLRPIVIQGNMAKIPAFYYRSRFRTWTLIEPTDGSYFEVPFNTNNSGERLYFSERAWANGQPFLLRSTGSTGPLAPDFRAPLILLAIYGVPQSDYPLAGAVPGGTARNAFGYGKAGVDQTPNLLSNTSFVNVTDPALTALGFTRGLKNTVNGRPYGGGWFKELIKPGRRIFARFYVQTDAEDAFTRQGRLYVFPPESGSSLATLGMTMEKRLSPTAAIYSGYFLTDSFAGGDRFLMGLEGQSVASFSAVVTGIQISEEPGAAGWIDPDDYPVPEMAEDLVYGSVIYGVVGRPLAFYPRQVSETYDREAFVSLGSIDADKRSYTVEGSAKAEIDPARLGATMTMVGQNLRGGLTDRRLSRTIETRISPASVSGAPKILMLGDSLTNYGVPRCVSDVLEEIGQAPVFIGKYNSANPGESSNTTGGPLAEGHSGWEFGDFTFAKTDRVTPLAPGEEATYEGLAKSGKIDFNTFLRAEVGSEPAARNGYVFDPEFWRTRWAVDLETPDIVCINIGTNDARDNAPPATFAGVLDGLQVMVPAFRAAWPSAHLVFYYPPMARSVEGHNRAFENVGIVKTILAYIRDLNDANVTFSAAYAHASSAIGYRLSTVTTTAIGTVQATMEDSIHIAELVQRQVAECVAAAIAYEV